jgi:hypothetical protein
VQLSDPVRPDVILRAASKLPRGRISPLALDPPDLGAEPPILWLEPRNPRLEPRLLNGAAASGVQCYHVHEMASAKQAVLDLVTNLPDDASLEDIQYHLYVLQRLASGLEEAESGKVISAEQMEERFAKWIVP